MSNRERISADAGVAGLLYGAAVIAALYFAKDFLFPLALAILLTFLLAPVVAWLERRRMGRILSVMTVVTICFGLMAILGFVITSQAYDIVARLPNYKLNIVEKAHDLKGNGKGFLEPLMRTFKELREDLSRGEKEIRSAQATSSNEQPTNSANHDLSRPIPNAQAGALPEEAIARPVPVEIVDQVSPEEIAKNLFGPLLPLLATAAMVLVFTIFMLIEHEDLRNRLIRLVGSRQLNFTTQALDDAAYRVRRYLLMQLIINSLFGLSIGVGLFLIGLPNAFFWGVVAMVLRFIPYLGPWIAAILPLILSLAVFEGWTRPVLVAGLFIIAELVSNNVLEPWLYGASTGISTIGILVSAVFWTWLWGPVGLVMATPLTVCLTVLGRYVPQFAFLNTLLSDQEPLPAHARFYQRLLALDLDEATEIAEDYLKDSSLDSLYDLVLLPALNLAEQDRHRGDLDERKQEFIHDTMRELVEDLNARALEAASASNSSSSATNGRTEGLTRQPAPVICLPARDEADEIAGMMLAGLLEAAGCETRTFSTDSLAGEMLVQVAEQKANIVCISALPPFAATHARYLCKRLRPKFPDLKVVVGLWQSSGSTKKAQERLAAAGIDKFAKTLADAKQQILPLATLKRAATTEERVSEPAA